MKISSTLHRSAVMCPQLSCYTDNYKCGLTTTQYACFCTLQLIVIRNLNWTFSLKKTLLLSFLDLWIQCFCASFLRDSFLLHMKLTSSISLTILTWSLLCVFLFRVFTLRLIHSGTWLSPLPEDSVSLMEHISLPCQPLSAGEKKI